MPFLTRGWLATHENACVRVSVERCRRDVALKGVRDDVDMTIHAFDWDGGRALGQHVIDEVERARGLPVFIDSTNVVVVAADDARVVGLEVTCACDALNSLHLAALPILCLRLIDLFGLSGTWFGCHGADFERFGIPQCIPGTNIPYTSGRLQVARASLCNPTSLMPATGRTYFLVLLYNYL